MFVIHCYILYLIVPQKGKTSIFDFTQRTMTTKVTLRKKKISKGRQSLYLDFYPAIPHPKTGKPTRREFLGLYIFEKTNNPFDRQHNKETLMIGEGIRQKRENVLNKPEIYTEYEKEQLRKRKLGDKCFFEFYEREANKRKNSNYDLWLLALNYLKTFTEGRLKFKDINESFLEGFKEYLLTTNSRRSKKEKLSQNTAALYFIVISSSLKQAYKEGFLQTDVTARVKTIKKTDTERGYLGLDELNTLVKTPCKNDLLKRAALFSALTGLRFSDIQKLSWNEVEFIKGEGYFLNFTQQKTQSIETLPISEQAYSFTGGLKDPRDMIQNEKVFPGLKYSAYHNKQLYKWIETAGITKKITFHCFRHTFATLQLFYGTDIYTVSKLLGHRDLKTTQVYAKIVDESKRKAVDKIKLNM